MLVAVVAHAAIDGMPWAAAFALGAIVSPTDPLAATAIMRRLGVPLRIVAIVEGESLINDGTALVVYRTAVAAAVGGTFSLLDASWDFVRQRRRRDRDRRGGRAGCSSGCSGSCVADDVVGVVLSLAAGYSPTCRPRSSACPACSPPSMVGLIVGRRSPELSTPASRLRGYAFWEVLVFLLNAVLFILVGLQLPAILEEQERSARRARRARRCWSARW